MLSQEKLHSKIRHLIMMIQTEDYSIVSGTWNSVSQMRTFTFCDVCDSIASRCQQCLDKNGGQFENRR